MDEDWDVPDDMYLIWSFVFWMNNVDICLTWYRSLV